MTRQHYVCAELSKRFIPNALLPDRFSDEDILLGKKGGEKVEYIQVKSSHPDRNAIGRGSWELGGVDFELWKEAKDNQFVVFVWLGSPDTNESPSYWIARKSEVGKKFAPMRNGSGIWRISADTESSISAKWNYPTKMETSWRNNWKLFDNYKTQLFNQRK
ncbi:MAG: hypothetical protein JRN52_02200 [Nitrososphaerota archaeon]|nr:hypothetical protein [Nitrososphaerota archaeon]